MPYVRRDPNAKVESQLTSMIDVVFQLLIFFILTFQVVAPEGQFGIKMPQSAKAQASTPVVSIPPLSVRLECDETGELARIVLGSRSLGTDMAALEFELAEAAGIGIEVEIDAAPKLKYDYLIKAINICARLKITSIKFAPMAKS
jgi:biopolymer transport protein ExbD